MSKRNGDEMSVVNQSAEAQELMHQDMLPTMDDTHDPADKPDNSKSYIGFRVRVTPETMSSIAEYTEKLGLDRNELIELGIALVTNAKRDDLAFFLKRVFEMRLYSILQNLP